MQRSLFVGVLVALAVAGGVASGQETQGQGTAELPQNATLAPRPRLGVRVDIRPLDTDSIGALIDSVVPGSPAERAGIRSGDLIVKVDGQPVGSTTPQVTAGLQLIRLVARLKPNMPTKVELRRGKTVKTVSVTSPQEITLVFQGSPEDSANRWSFRIPASDSDNGSGSLLSLMASPLSSIETAALNTELGSYFGTTEGILIIKCPPETGLSLKGGDVVLAVNDRAPTSPAHFIRLLQRFSANGPVKLSVLRHGKRLTVASKLNAAAGH